MTILSMPDVRKLATELARYACENEGNDRSSGDRVFDEVTQARAGFKGYSACGDLCHFVLWHLFCYLGTEPPLWVNRDDVYRTFNPRREARRLWRVGMNIASLVHESGGFVWAHDGGRPEPGDVLFLRPPEHVCILDSWGDDGFVISWDYGQRDEKGQPSARMRERELGRTLAPYPTLGDRPLVGWVSLEKLFGPLLPEREAPER